MSLYPDYLLVSSKRYREELPPVISPVAPRRYFVLWDWLRPDWDGVLDADRKSMPCVFRCGEYDNTNNGHYTRLTSAWQFFWLGLASRVVFSRHYDQLTPTEYTWLAKRLTSVGGNTTAFTNGHGLTKYRNYLLNENMDMAEDPMIYTLVCGGASLGGDVEFDRLRVSAFDGTKPPPDVRTIDPFTDPRVFFANTITQGVGGAFRVYRFPQFGGDDVPVPLIARKPIYYELKNLERYESTAKRKPYYP
jgi:hypothetical protein